MKGEMIIFTLWSSTVLPLAGGRTIRYQEFLSIPSYPLGYAI